MVVVTTAVRMIVVFCLLQLTTMASAAEARDGSRTLPANHMVVAANPHASRAGMDMLLAGGSAADAAVAIELVLSLVEPQSSGIGGGAFMLYYDAAAESGNRIEAFDGRETAPQETGPDLFAGVEKSRAGFLDASLGGRATGTPGALHMLHLAHEKHGKLPWKLLFQPAIALAENGFSISPRMHFLLDRDPLLRKVPGSHRYFYDKDGKARAIGHVLKNPDYAHTLKLIAEKGPGVFYEGEIARKILAAVHGSVKNPGQLSLTDMTGYKSKIRAPVCSHYRSFKICGMPPPSSGGMTVSAILGILESFDLPSMSAGDAKAIHLVIEAERLAYADRDYYVADPDYINVPQDGLLDAAYLRARAGLIDPEKSMGQADHGTPHAALTVAKHSQGFTPELPSTSHFSIVDQWGNVVSMTASVGSAFGNRHMAAGFMLNNELTDFTFFGTDSDNLPANAPAGGKRPRSSMAPTIVLDGLGRPVLVLGTPGGSSIIALVAQSIINVLDWNMTVEEAINTPHFMSRNGPVFLEGKTAAHALMAPLMAMGHEVKESTFNSGLHAIRIRYGADGMDLQGGADKRREGLVLTQ